MTNPEAPISILVDHMSKMIGPKDIATLHQVTNVNITFADDGQTAEAYSYIIGRHCKAGVEANGFGPISHK